MTATITEAVSYTYNGQTFEYAIDAEIPLEVYQQFDQIRGERGRCGDVIRLEEIEQRGLRGNNPPPYSGWACSLPRHDADQPHIAVLDRTVQATWGAPQTAPVEPDSEVDPEPPPFELEEGVIYKFRNKPTLLVYVRTRRDGQIEVLDLTHQRWRVLDKSKLVPRREGAASPTPEQMRWVAEFLAERRRAVRDNALTQKRSGYFDRNPAEFDEILRELSLAPLQQVLSGSVSVTFTFTSPTLTQAKAKEKFEEWRRTLTLPEGFAVKEIALSSNMEVKKE